MQTKMKPSRPPDPTGRIPATLLVASLFLACASMQAHAGTIVYDGTDTSLLRPESISVTPGANSLYPDSPSGNRVTVTGGSPGTVFGGLSDVGEVTGNTVHFNGGSTAIVYGGYSSTGQVSGNTVDFSGGSVIDIDGGYSVSSTVTGNTVNIHNATAFNISGGESLSGNVTGNTVNFSSGSAENLYGGSTRSGSANGNTVNLSGTIDNSHLMNVYGGDSDTGSANGNTVRATGVRGSDPGQQNAFYIFGGYSLDGHADTSHNTIIITDSDVGYVYAGDTKDGDASGNTIVFNSGTAVQINGGRTGNGNSDGNTIYVNGGTPGSITGGNSQTGSASGNTIHINNYSASGTGHIYGGSTYSGDASGNVIHFNNGEFANSIQGGSSIRGKATGNTINLNGGNITGDILGGLSSNGDDFTGNTLNVNSRHNDMTGVHNFQYLNFTLPTDFQPNGNDSMLTAYNVFLSFHQNPAELTTVQTIDIAPGNHNIKPGDTVTLIRATDIPMGGTLASDRAKGAQGLSFLYDWENVRITNDDPVSGPGTLTASLAAMTVNPQSRALLYGRATELALLKQGGDLLAGQAIENMAASARKGSGGFIAMQGGESHYKTGPDFHLDSFTMMAGGAWDTRLNATTDLLAGAFFETGTGHYRGYHGTDGMATVKGYGNARYYGIGLLGRLDFNNGFSADAALRAGRIETDLKTDFYHAGQMARFDDTSSTYYGAHITGAYKWALAPDQHLNTYARYSWTHINGDNVNVLGDEFNFKSADSHRIRIGTKYARTSGSFMPYAGIAWEYEFDGREGGQIIGYTMKDIDLGGSTVIAELGVSWLPANRDNLRLNVGVEGFAGNREGVMASARLNYRF